MDLLDDKGLEIKVVNGIEVAEHLTLKLKGILNCLGGIPMQTQDP